MKNMPKILIVSITKLKIALLIIVQNLVVNNVYFSKTLQNYYTKLPKVVSEVRKMNFFCIFLLKKFAHVRYLS